MSAPTLNGTSYSCGVIVESWRLWEHLSPSVDLAATCVRDWRLDNDYFEATIGSASRPLAIVIAQGASLAADAVERLAGSGARCVIRLGTTGGLQPDAAIGDLVVPYCAVRGEGTSGHYLPPEVPALADPALVRSLCDALSAQQQSEINPSLVWTTDGRWCESDEQIRAYSEIGVAAVDMETAGLFAAAMRRRVRAASVSVVADVPVLHIGRAFKGTGGSRAEWDRVVERAAVAFRVILAVCAAEASR